MPRAIIQPEGREMVGITCNYTPLDGRGTGYPPSQIHSIGLASPGAKYQPPRRHLYSPPKTLARKGSQFGPAMGNLYRIEFLRRFEPWTTWTPGAITMRDSGMTIQYDGGIHCQVARE